MFEHKYRGPLSEEKLQKLRAYLTKNGRCIKAGKERVIYYDTSIFPQIGDFTTGFSRISLKLDAKTAELRMKVGNPSEARREKIFVTIRKKQVNNLILILHHLGLECGFYRPNFREDFLIHGVVVSLKTNCVMGDHVEINLLDKAHEMPGELKSILHAFKISLWSKELYQKRITRLMKKSPPINVYNSHLFT